MRDTIVVSGGGGGRSRRARIVPALALTLLVACSGNDPIVYPPPDVDEGLSAEYVSPAMNALSFSRFAVNVVLFNWDVLDRLDLSWHYDGATAAWAKYDSSYQAVTVGTTGGGSTEIRDENVVAFEVQFLDENGVPQQDLLTAARARMELRVRQRRYALDSSYVLDEAYDITARFTTGFGLDAGSADTLVAAGSVAGWWTRTTGDERPRVDYVGTAGLEFDFPDHYVVCPAERLSADIRIFGDGVELDRFTGSFAAAADDDRYTGALDSEKGPWRYAVDGNRSCPGAAAEAAAPAALDLTITRVAR